MNFVKVFGNDFFFSHISVDLNFDLNYKICY